MLLSIKNLVVNYGQVEAVKGVSLDMLEGAIVCLLGANGAGKSTILHTISGLQKPTCGEIWYKGQRIDGLPPDAMVKMGITQIPEGKALFPYMTVKETLEMGAYTRRGSKREIQKDIDELIDRFPLLEGKMKAKVSELSGGQQQAVAIARALMAKPTLLLMDEPTQGLGPVLIEEVVEKIVRELCQMGVTIFLIEQNVPVALRLGQKVYILEQGQIAFTGSVEEFSQDEYVKKIYLGG